MSRRHADDAYLSTRQIADALGVRHRRVFTLGRCLGMAPGAEVSLGRDGQPVSRRVWLRSWIPELRAELARRDGVGLDFDALRAGPPDPDGAYDTDDGYDAILRELGVLP